jgi:signal transduction histidine kinase
MAKPGEYAVTILTGDLAGYRFSLETDTATIGRNAANDVCLPMDPRISRWHAQLRLEPEGVVLEDRNSGNGTWVGQTRIYTPVVLPVGGQFRLGRTWLQLDRVPTEALESQGVSERVVLVDAAEEADESPADSDQIVYSVGPGPLREAESIDELRRRLHAFEQVGIALGSSLDLGTVLYTLVDSVMQVIKAERGFLLLLDPQTNQPTPRVVRQPEAQEQGVIQLSRHIVDKALAERIAVLTSDAMQDQRFQNVESVVGFQIRSAMCVPIYRMDRNLGVLYLDTTSRSSVFSEADLEMVTGLASQAAVAIENARLYTDLRRAYEEVQAAQSQLLRTERLTTIGALSASIAHDMGNVVTPLVPLVRLLLRTSSPDPELAESTERQLARLMALIRRLLSFSTPTSVHKERVNVNEVLAQTLGLLQTEANHRGVSIVRELATDLPPVVGDVGELDRVFLNLALNAIQAAPEGRGRLTVCTEEDEGEVAISFSDDGPGIPSEVLPHLFEPLFTTKEGGTGLGLFSCKRIVENEHDGTIEVDSRPEEGTTITVRLPVAPAAGPGAPTDA